MSVKFAKETIQETSVRGSKHGIAHDIGEKLLGGEKHGIAHGIGERLTGGESQQGYLAVRRMKSALKRTKADWRHVTGLPQATSDQPASYEDADLWDIVRFTRTHRVLDCARSQ